MLKKIIICIYLFTMLLVFNGCIKQRPEEENIPDYLLFELITKI